MSSGNKDTCLNNCFYYILNNFSGTKMGQPVSMAQMVQLQESHNGELKVYIRHEADNLFLISGTTQSSYPAIKKWGTSQQKNENLPSFKPC